jgi:Fe-S cluster biogenesis protein NfuA
MHARQLHEQCEGCDMVDSSWQVSISKESKDVVVPVATFRCNFKKTVRTHKGLA